MLRIHCLDGMILTIPPTSKIPVTCGAYFYRQVMLANDVCMLLCQKNRMSKSNFPHTERKSPGATILVKKIINFAKRIRMRIAGQENNGLGKECCDYR